MYSSKHGGMKMTMATTMTLREIRRYDAENVIESAIIGAIDTLKNKSGIGAYDIYGEWIDEEDGQIAIDRLVNLIIY
jgi:hypothetical protein